MTPIRFRVVDLKKRKVIRDPSHFHAFIERRDGIGTVVFNDDNLMPLLMSGRTTINGQEIFDADIIEFEWSGQMLTDSVHLTEEGWVVGSSRHPLESLRVHRVVGSAWETIWPVDRPGL